MSRTFMHAIGLTVASICAACSHYGWADRPGVARVDDAIGVHTVEVDSDATIDGASLTRHFVDDLRRAGARSARWTAASTGDTVTCDVAFDRQEMFGDHAYAHASARCLVGGEHVAMGRGQAELALDESERTLGRSRAFEHAARHALAAAADEVVRYFQQRSNDGT